MQFPHNYFTAIQVDTETTRMMILFQYLLCFLILLCVKSSCCERCNPTQLNRVRLDRPGRGGRLEVCVRYIQPETLPMYEWRNICSDYVEIEARILCHLLGYSNGGKKIINLYSFLKVLSLFRGEDFILWRRWRHEYHKLLVFSKWNSWSAKLYAIFFSMSSSGSNL